jgi:hypothetical protein
MVGSLQLSSSLKKCILVVRIGPKISAVQNMLVVLGFLESCLANLSLFPLGIVFSLSSQLMAI